MTIVPLLAGGGTRLKILEAAASGVPVVSTPVGAEGLDFERGSEILIARGAEEFRRSGRGAARRSRRAALAGGRRAPASREALRLARDRPRLRSGTLPKGIGEMSALAGLSRRSRFSRRPGRTWAIRPGSSASLGARRSRRRRPGAGAALARNRGLRRRRGGRHRRARPEPARAGAARPVPRSRSAATAAVTAARRGARSGPRAGGDASSSSDERRGKAAVLNDLVGASTGRVARLHRREHALRARSGPRSGAAFTDPRSWAPRAGGSCLERGGGRQARRPVLGPGDAR